jgi:hypothetical protein
MKTSIKPRLADLIIIILAFALLVPGFYGNTWRAAGKKWFVDWQKYHEHMVVARLVQSRQAGIFSYGGLLGFGDITTWDVDQRVIEHEYELFANGGEFRSYWAYDSVPGFHAILFSAIQSLFHLAPATSLKLDRLLEALLAASVLGLFLVWLAREFGLFSASVVLLFMASSEWMTLFGANFYWNLWAFYLPLAVLCIYLMRAAETGRIRGGQVFILMTGTLLVKCLFTGFEFISTALVMPFSALVYYALRQNWTLKYFLRQFVVTASGAITGTLAALVVLAAQIASVSGGWSQALEYILRTLGKRTYGDPALYTGIEAESLRANVVPVLQTYLNGRALNLSSIFRTNLIHLEFNYMQVIMVFVFFSVIFVFKKRYWGGFNNNKLVGDLIITTWFSALAPLSWFVLFRAHSYIHTQINFIIWQMPFVLFGFAMCAFIVANWRRRVVVGSTAN